MDYLKDIEIGPTIFERNNADYQIGAMSKEIQEWDKNTPPDKFLVVTLHTPDGRTMLIEQVRAIAQQTYVAEGYIGSNEVYGHGSYFNASFVLQLRPERRS